MFDYMIKILSNNRLLVRDNKAQTSVNLRADQVSAYFENVLEEQLEAQRATDEKVSSIKTQAGTSDKAKS